jgi:hypothetical protein
MNLNSGANLKLPSFQKLFPNVTNLKITWRITCGEYDHDKDFFYAFLVDLRPMNSMKQIRKFEMDYMNDTMIGQLDLKQLREFHMSQWVFDFGLGDEYRFDDDQMDRMANWLSFIRSSPQLEVLNVPNWDLSIEHLQIALENLPLLKCLNFKVVGYSFGLIGDRPDITEYLPQYKLEQAEKTARLIGENYDRFGNLRLELNRDCGKRVADCLEKYSNVKIEKCGEAVEINKI